MIYYIIENGGNLVCYSNLSTNAMPQYQESQRTGRYGGRGITGLSSFLGSLDYSDTPSYRSTSSTVRHTAVYYFNTSLLQLSVPSYLHRFIFFFCVALSLPISCLLSRFCILRQPTIIAMLIIRTVGITTSFDLSAAQIAPKRSAIFQSQS